MIKGNKNFVNLSNQIFINLSNENYGFIKHSFVNFKIQFC